MTGIDFIKLTLIGYGFTNKLRVKKYYGVDGVTSIGYDVYAENSKGDCYSEENCDGLMFHLYLIQDYMIKHGITPVVSPYQGFNYSVQELLNMHKTKKP